MWLREGEEEEEEDQLGFGALIINYHRCWETSVNILWQPLVSLTCVQECRMRWIEGKNISRFEAESNERELG